MDLFDIAVARTLSGGGGGGGGGDSDFSTATMTVINPNWKLPSIHAPVCIDVLEEDFYMSAGDFTPGDGTTTRKIILYKGLSSIYIDKRGETMSFSVSGNIEDDGDGYYYVSGDCTITIS